MPLSETNAGPVRRNTVRDFARMKSVGQPITMVTAYDAAMAKLADLAGIDSILVGDSYGNVSLGYDSTIPVTLDDMVRATAAVVRGSSRPFVIADMPFMTYQTSRRDALKNAARLMQDGHAQAVKLEGGMRSQETIAAIVEADIPVMGHVGFTPQSLHAFGGYRVQGKGADQKRVIQDAKAVEDAGAFSVVLELVPSELSAIVTSELDIPTIGIGAGPHCSGQVQVLHDILGIDPDFAPKHAKQYANLAETVTEALGRYASEVRGGQFPKE